MSLVKWKLIKTQSIQDNSLKTLVQLTTAVLHWQCTELRNITNMGCYYQHTRVIISTHVLLSAHTCNTHVEPCH